MHTLYTETSVEIVQTRVSLKSELIGQLLPALVRMMLNSLVVAELYRHSLFFSSQKWWRAGKPTIRSGKLFQTSKAKFISSAVIVTSSSSERNARELTRAELWNLERGVHFESLKISVTQSSKQDAFLLNSHIQGESKAGRNWRSQNF